MLCGDCNRDRPPWHKVIPFGWAYEGQTWDDANERLATVIVCEFLYWGGR